MYNFKVNVAKYFTTKFRNLSYQAFTWEICVMRKRTVHVHLSICSLVRLLKNILGRSVYCTTTSLFWGAADVFVTSGPQSRMPR